LNSPPVDYANADKRRQAAYSDQRAHEVCPPAWIRLVSLAKAN
jgi:hypothetical protein